MAKLTAKARKSIPTKDFAGPGRSYPIENRAHAANAKARATQQEAAGNLTPKAANTIKAKADAKLGEYRGAGAKGSSSGRRTAKVRGWTGK